MHFFFPYVPFNMKTNKYWALIFLLFTSTTVKAQKKNNIQLFLSGLDSIKASLKIPGMAVAKGDSILFKDALGYADLKHNIKVTPNTTFRVASITKTLHPQSLCNWLKKAN